MKRGRNRVEQGFSALGKAGFHEGEKLALIRHRDGRLTSYLKAHYRAINLGRRHKAIAANAEKNLTLGIVFHRNGDRSRLARGNGGTQTLRSLLLHHNHNFINRQSALKQLHNYRRGDIIGQISTNRNPLAIREVLGYDCAEIQLHRIAENHANVRKVSERLVENRCKTAVKLDGHHALGGNTQLAREHTDAGADFEHSRFIIGGTTCHAGTNGFIYYKVLTKRLFEKHVVAHQFFNGFCICEVHSTSPFPKIIPHCAPLYKTNNFFAAVIDFVIFLWYNYRVSVNIRRKTMEQKIIDAVLAELRPTLEGYEEKDGAFIGESKAFKVEYNEEKEIFCLLTAEVTAGEVGSYSVASSYLFDSTQRESDAAAVGIDFNDTVTSLLGINTRKARRSMDVALPSKSDSDTADIGELCNKILAIFPTYKDLYKERVAENGEFLYIDFFLETAAKEIEALLEADNKKKLKKIYDSLNDLYVRGDRNVGNTIIVVILGGAIKGDEAKTAKMLEGLEAFPYLKKPVRQIAMRTKKDRLLREIYGI